MLTNRASRYVVTMHTLVPLILLQSHKKIMKRLQCQIPLNLKKKMFLWCYKENWWALAGEVSPPAGGLKSSMNTSLIRFMAASQPRPCSSFSLHTWRPWWHPQRCRSPLPTEQLCWNNGCHEPLIILQMKCFHQRFLSSCRPYRLCLITWSITVVEDTSVVQLVLTEVHFSPWRLSLSSKTLYIYI